MTPRAAPRTVLAVSAGVAPLVVLSLVAPALHPQVLVALAVAYTVSSLGLLAGVGLLPRETKSLLALLAGVALMAGGFAIARWLPRHDVVSGVLASAGVLLTAGTVGARIGERIAEPGHLLAVALASSAADVWSLTAPSGPTHAVVVTTDVALQRLVALSTAVPPDPTPVAMIGLGDVVFVALYATACAVHGLSPRRTWSALAVGLLLAGGCTFVLHRALPALPFLGACVVLAHRAAWRVPRRDRMATGFAAGLLVLALLYARLR